MKSLLIIKSSVMAGQSKSGALADEYQRIWLENNPGGKVTQRDLAASPIAALDGHLAGAFFTPEDQRTAEQVALVAQSDALIAELKAHNDIVITAPMYNFTFPVQLKNYFDSIARAGITFKYTDKGPVGLLTEKRALVIASRGGIYPEGADNQTPLLRQFLGFIGIQDVEFVYAEGLNLGEESADASMAQAKQALTELA